MVHVAVLAKDPVTALVKVIARKIVLIVVARHVKAAVKERVLLIVLTVVLEIVTGLVHMIV